MRRHHSFKRSTTAEDGDMALALALHQAESQNDTTPAAQPPYQGDPLSALHSATPFKVQFFHEPGTCRLPWQRSPVHDV